MEPLLSIFGELVLLAAKWKAAQQENLKNTFDSSGLEKKIVNRTNKTCTNSKKLNN